MAEQENKKKKKKSNNYCGFYGCKSFYLTDECISFHKFAKFKRTKNIMAK